MDEQNNQLDELRQITNYMEEHNIVKYKKDKDKLEIERGRQEDAIDPTQKKRLDENQKAEALRLAAIILNCPYPCPHWSHESSIPEENETTGSTEKTK